MPSCSKAPRGLFVLVWIDGIFTANALSPSPSLRQCPDRYAIRAGQNLPDKEFRYLRTVIVTAAVHRGFSRQHTPTSLTFRHRAGVSPYTSSFELAETCVFGKQSPGLINCGPTAASCRKLQHSIYIYKLCCSLLLSPQSGGRAGLIPKLRPLLLPSSLTKVLSLT